MNFEELSKVIHDIKQPVSNIKASASMIENVIKDEPVDKKAIEQFCGIIHRSCNSINLLATNFHDIINCRNRVMTANYSSCNLEEYITMYISSVKPYVDSCNVNLQTNILHGDVVFSCDYEKLTRVLNNLITNSIKYNTNEDKTIKIDIDVVKGNLMLSVTDNGIGIPKNDINKIFQCNYRAKNGISIARGCGLGMAIVKEFVECLNGTLEIKSKVNSGTKITLTLPEGSVVALNSVLKINEFDPDRIKIEFSTVIE
ncbi:MAG: HAMP domain-containing histidine kinase [Clostridia bacterium]|nr:HAMP domain-containing histidine kinase [Clostridia bacterium]